MAHFAQLDSDNRIIQVIVVDDNAIIGADGQESEEAGIKFCHSIFGSNTTWVQASYTGRFRKRFPAIGDTYDAKKDCFVADKPFPSFKYDEDTGEWMPPQPYPQNGKSYVWDDETGRWIETN